MTDYLELALERGEGAEEPFFEPEAEREMVGDARFHEGQVFSVGRTVPPAGAPHVRRAALEPKQPPYDPPKAPEGESFDSLPLRTPLLSDQGRGLAGLGFSSVDRWTHAAGTHRPLSLESSPGCFAGKGGGPYGLLRNPVGAQGKVQETDRDAAPGRSEGQGLEGLVPEGRGAGELPLLAAVRRAGEAAAFTRGGRRSFDFALPKAGEAGPGWSMEELDRAVERDARRYDGGSSLY